jgi:hypothetical protein
VKASEPVVAHSGREGGCGGRDEARPTVSFYGLLGGAQSRSTSSSLLSSLSNVASGTCPALRADSSTMQSEKPSLGLRRNRAKAAATTSGSCNTKFRWLSSMSIAVASGLWGSSKTESKTQITSMRTMWDTQAPLATKASARAVWRGSSRVRRRMTTLVSTARMSLGHSSSQTGLQFTQRFPRSAFRKKCRMDFLRRMRACTANKHTFTIFFPFQYRARCQAELAPYLRGYGDLTLSSQFRRGERHALTLPW